VEYAYFSEGATKEESSISPLIKWDNNIGGGRAVTILYRRRRRRRQFLGKKATNDAFPMVVSSIVIEKGNNIFLV
jgi:hypothetical protein